MRFSDLARIAAAPVDSHVGENTLYQPWTEGEFSDGAAAGPSFEVFGITARGRPETGLTKGSRPGNDFGVAVHTSQVMISYSRDLFPSRQPRQGDRITFLEQGNALFRVADIITESKTHIC